MIGGGIIGLEMACVYDALGSKVTVVELLDQLIPGCDPDLVRPLQQADLGRYEAIHLGAEVDVREGRRGRAERRDRRRRHRGVRPDPGRGRAARPNGPAIDAEAAGVTVDERGFMPVDAQMRTNVEEIYAIGDIVGGPMLAHKASHEGKVAAEVIAGARRRSSTRGRSPQSPTPTPRSRGWA